MTKVTKAKDSFDLNMAPSLDVTGLTLPIFEAVLADFAHQSISYCYWKSTRRIHSIMAGDGDLDLLVAGQDQHRAEMVLLGRGFKLFPMVASLDHPSILSFLGYEESNGRLVHVHLHIRLIVGEPLFKNYHLPWEEIILKRSVYHSELPIRVLDPTMEALLLVVRGCLEHSRLDIIALKNSRVVAQKLVLDRMDVMARIDRAELRNLAAKLLSDELADMVVEAVCGEQPFEHQRRFRRRIARLFTSYRTYNGFELRLRSASRAVTLVFGSINSRFLHLPRPWRRRAPGGGCVAAIVGLDGSGKTTVSAAIAEWLGSEVDVVPVYFGTGAGRPSMLLRPFKLIVPVMRRILKTKPRGCSHGKSSGQAPGALYSVCMLCWAVIVAFEKRNKLTRARRAADRGLVVISDRYPQDEIVGFNDGPLLQRLSNVPRWLTKFECSAYALARRLPPDLVIKLNVVPETVAKREPDMDSGVIHQRIADLRRLTFASARVITVDAERPLKEVIHWVKREVWRLL